MLIRRASWLCWEDRWSYLQKPDRHVAWSLLRKHGDHLGAYGRAHTRWKEFWTPCLPLLGAIDQGQHCSQNSDHSERVLHSTGGLIKFKGHMWTMRWDWGICMLNKQVFLKYRFFRPHFGKYCLLALTGLEFIRFLSVFSICLIFSPNQWQTVRQIKHVLSYL